MAVGRGEYDGERWGEGWPWPGWMLGNSAGHTHQNYFKINYFFKSLKFWIKCFLIVYVLVFGGGLAPSLLG